MIKYDQDGVRLEKTGWRDEWISNRHRTWGFDCPATDIDFLMVEYSKREPMALIEYKTVGSMKYLGHKKALLDHLPVSRLATMANLPSFIVAYDQKEILFYVKSTNSIGEAKLLVDTWRVMAEKSFVDFLYHLRGICTDEV